MKKLPDNWCKVALGEISSTSSGIGFPLQFQGKIEGELGFYKVGDISKAVIEQGGFLKNPQHCVSKEIAVELKGKPIPSGATVFAKIGEAVKLNRRAFVVDECLIDNNVMAVKAFQSDSDRYIYMFLRTRNFTDLSRATTVPSLRKGDIESLIIPLAPLNEQKRIADKLDCILARVDACRERLDRIPAILKRFRQSVLAAATSGKLTEEWRNETGNDKPWKTVRLAEIAHIQGGVTKDSKKQSLNDEEVPYLRVANVQRGYLDLGDIKIIRIPVSKLNALLLEPGDILFNEGGDIDKLGRGWIWEGQIEQCSFQNHVFRARLYDKKNQPKYISWWGNYRGLNYFLRSGKQTTNLASINKSMLSELPINLPSFEEQTEIVRRVEEMFAYADRIEARYHAARARIDKLTPAILAKAFRGELVPQNPDDEPASVLLDRIRASRAANAATSKPERRRNRGAK
ncbi:MAG: restriction endonuclease subunit S [Nitrosomonas sp.]|nr:restriction endonuclease subunit S [Nitrosomonas sp.]